MQKPKHVEIGGAFFYSFASGFDQSLQVLSQPGMVSGCGVTTAVRDRVALIQFEGKASKSSCPQVGFAICRDRWRKLFLFMVKNIHC